MEILAPIFWIFLFAAIAILVIVSQTKQSEKLAQTYRDVANRFGGRAIPGGVFGRPTLSFDRHGAHVLVDIYSTGGKNARYYTQVHLPWPDLRTRCEVYPERFSSRLGKLLGMTDLEIGSPDFDRDFIITGNSTETVRELLTWDVQQKIYHLRRITSAPYTAGDDIYVSITGGKMLVKKLGYIRVAEKLIEYIEAALDLYDSALGHQGSGIEFMGESTAASAEVVCQICGEEITAEMVHCRRCKTPHHEDCWQYFGGCSTFGCGEKRYAAGKYKV